MSDQDGRDATALEKLTDVLENTADNHLDMYWRSDLTLEEIAKSIMDEHAHELAEEIRAKTRLLKEHGVLEPDKFRPCRDAADQIDPEVGDD